MKNINQRVGYSGMDIISQLESYRSTFDALASLAHEDYSKMGFGEMIPKERIPDLIQLAKAYQNAMGAFEARISDVSKSIGAHVAAQLDERGIINKPRAAAGNQNTIHKQ
jgi:hypothetical protein